MKNVLILDASQASATLLDNIVHSIDRNIHTYLTCTKQEAYSCAMEIDIDLILFDPVLHDGTSRDMPGMQFAQNIRRVPRYQFTPLIAVTSLEDPKLFFYSVLHCYSYLEKPVDCAKTRRIIREALQYSNRPEQNSYYLYRKDGVLCLLNNARVICIETYHKVVTVRQKDGEVIIPYIPFDRLLKELRSRDFLQCSRSCIVNRQFIENVDVTNRYVKMRYLEEPVSIGDVFKKRFLAELAGE